MFALGCQTASQQKYSLQPARHPTLRPVLQSRGPVQGWGCPQAWAGGQDQGPGLAGCPILAVWYHSDSERGPDEVEGMSSACQVLAQPMGLVGIFGCSCRTHCLALTQVSASPKEASQLAPPSVWVCPTTVQLWCTPMASWGAGGVGRKPDPSFRQPRCPAPWGPTCS